MSFTLKQLRVFVTVAQAGSFVEAASILHVTSAALSVTIKSLEDEVGFRVFERTTRSVRCTPEGEALLQLAQHLLAEHARMVQAVAGIKDQKKGLVKLAATQLLACSILPPAVTRFQAKWPDVEVIQLPAPYDNVQGMLQRREVDIAVGPERLPEPGISAEPLFSSRLHLVCSRRHRFAALKSVRWPQLEGETVYLADSRGASVLARDSRYAVNFEQAREVGHFSTAVAMTAEDTGVMFAPAFTRKLLQPYDVAMVPMAGPAAKRNFRLFRNERVLLSPSAALLVEHLEAEFAAGV